MVFLPAQYINQGRKYLKFANDLQCFKCICTIPNCVPIFFGLIFPTPEDLDVKSPDERLPSNLIGHLRRSRQRALQEDLSYHALYCTFVTTIHCLHSENSPKLFDK